MQGAQRLSVVPQVVESLLDDWTDAVRCGAPPERWSSLEYRLHRLTNDVPDDLPGLRARLHLLEACCAQRLGERGSELRYLARALALVRNDPGEAALAANLRRGLHTWFVAPRVFLGHAPEDAGDAAACAAALSAADVAVLCEAPHPRPGVSTKDLCAHRFRAAGVFVVLWSRAYAQRPSSAEELQEAFRIVDEEAPCTGGSVQVIFCCLDEQPIPDAYDGEMYAVTGAAGDPDRFAELVWLLAEVPHWHPGWKMRR